MCPLSYQNVQNALIPHQTTYSNILLPHQDVQIVVQQVEVLQRGALDVKRSVRKTKLIRKDNENNEIGCLPVWQDQ
jgi:hypothetical protein